MVKLKDLIVTGYSYFYDKVYGLITNAERTFGDSSGDSIVNSYRRTVGSTICSSSDLRIEGNTLTIPVELSSILINFDMSGKTIKYIRPAAGSFYNGKTLTVVVRGSTSKSWTFGTGTETGRFAFMDSGAIRTYSEFPVLDGHYVEMVYQDGAWYLNARW